MNTHYLTDDMISEFWPDIDTDEGRADIRRQFDALMEQCRTTKRDFPRWPDTMSRVVLEKARTLPDRINGLKAALDAIPAHLRKYQWTADPKAAFGQKYIRFHDVVGDDGHGFGRQWIATVPADRGYFGGLADFIAAANPDTVSMLIARIEELEKEIKVAKGGE